MNKQKAGYFEGIISVVVNIGLFAAKLWVGIVTGSIALAADAWHTLSDSISSVFVIIGARLSSRKPDKEHPFGHGRWEQIISLFIAVFLGIIAYNFLENSIVQFRNRQSVDYGMAAIIVTIVSIVVKEALAQVAFYLGKKTNNDSIKADGWHHRTDALSSIVVLAGILFAKQFWWIDSALGAIISVLLFYTTFRIINETASKILGEEASSELIDKINSEIKNLCKDELKTHHFHLHNYITHKELTFHIRIDKDKSIEYGHNIANEIEKMILEKFNITATIHTEPLDKQTPEASL